MSRSIPVRIQGLDPVSDLFVDVQVDSAGVVATSGGGGGGGSVTQGTSPWVVSAASLPLPTGAAKDSTLTDGTLRVGGTVAVTGTFWQATQPVSAASLPLPSGAATSSKQDSQTTLLGGGLPSALASDRLKVDGSGVTQPVSGTFWQATQPVSGTVTANAGTGPWPVTDNSGSLTVDNSGTFAVQATLAAETTKVIGTVNQGTSPWVTSRNWTLSSGTDSVSASVSNWPATQAVTQSTSPWVVAGNVASGAADSGNPVKVGGVYNLTKPVLGDGQRADLQLDSSGNLGVVMRSGTNTLSVAQPNADAVNPATAIGPLTLAFGYQYNGSGWDRIRGDTTYGLDVDVTRSALPSGAATSANQASELTLLAGGLPAALGQTTMSASLPVVLASDQTTSLAMKDDLLVTLQRALLLRMDLLLAQFAGGYSPPDSLSL